MYTICLRSCPIALQGVFTLYDTKYFSLAEWIVVAGAATGLFAVSVPNLHLLRIWSSLSCILVLIFVAIPVGIAFHDGGSPHMQQFTLFCLHLCCHSRSYSLLHKYVSSHISIQRNFCAHLGGYIIQGILSQQ